MLIAQITDTHIVAKGQHWLSEPSTETARRLIKVVDFLNSMNPLPYVVLLTGDASEDGSENSYAYVKELLQPLKAPLFVLPGNHDIRDGMRKAFSDHPYIPSQGFIQYAINDFPVRLIGLDTLVEGKHHGLLCDERLGWLEKALMQENEKPTLIFMHHPPVKVGVKLFDQIICFAPPAFEKMIQNKENVIGIVSGHYHHMCLSSFGTKPCFIAPSVAPVHYIAHPQDEHVTALELEDPAITLHQWNGGNVMISHVIRLKNDYQRIRWK